MQEVVDNLKKTPIGISRMRGAVPEARVMLYDDLPADPKYEKVVKGKRCLILLYQLHNRGRPTDGMGHYVLVQREGNRLLYFSSYGLGPEQEIAATHSKGKLLSMLGKKYIRNTVGLQKKFHTATCGRWCVLKTKLADVPLKKFTKIFSRRQQIDPDGIAVLATMFLIR